MTMVGIMDMTMGMHVCTYTNYVFVSGRAGVCTHSRMHTCTLRKLILLPPTYGPDTNARSCELQAGHTWAANPKLSDG